MRALASGSSSLRFVTLAALGLSSTVLAFAACSSTDDAGDASRNRPNSPSIESSPEFARAPTTTVVIASPASKEVFVTTKATVSLRGLSSGKVDAVSIETSTGAKVAAKGTNSWSADDVPVELGTSRVTVSANDAKDSLVVVRTKQLGFTEPATIYPDGVVVGKETAAVVRVPLDPASTIERDSLAVYRKASATKLTQIGTLHDDGKNGDEKANDGVFSTTVLLQEAQVGRTALYVGGKGPDGDEQALAMFVDVVEPIDPADIKAGRALLNDLQKTFEATGDYNKVLEQVRSSPLVLEHAISAEGGDFSISLRLKGDIPAHWSRPLPAGYRANPGNVVGNNKAFIAAAYLKDFSPYDESPAVQGGFASTTCPAWNDNTGPLLSDGQVTVESLRHLTDFGAVHISTHGGTWAAMARIGEQGEGCDLDAEKCTQGFNWYNGPSTEVILYTAEHDTDPPTADRLATQDYSAEMRQGRIGINYGAFFVTPKFFAKMPKRFPNSAVMFSSCRGAFNSTMGDAIVAKGAGVYLGFSEIVSSGFADPVSRGLWSCLLDNEKNNGEGASVAECLPSAMCDTQSSASPGGVGCELTNGVITCAPVDKTEFAIACLRTTGDTSLKLPHQKPDGASCQGVAAGDVCGDGKRTGNETCDGADINGASCASIFGAGYVGIVSCTSTCELETSTCAVCNNDGKKDDAEQCDGADVGGQLCPDGVTPYGCGSNCVLDPTPCGGTPGPVCNPNGLLEAGEACDGTNFGGLDCASATGVADAAGVLLCTNCQIDTSWCASVCPAEPATCATCNRDGVRQDTEQCDGSDIPWTCETLGYVTGSIACDTSCRLDASQCVPKACAGGTQNGTLEFPELCDGEDFGGATCASLLKDSRQKGQLKCLDNCTIDTSGCALSCIPDGIKSDDEACDGTDFGGETCASVTGNASSTGALSCNGDCSINASACGTCNGNGKKDGAEECEGSDVGGVTCASTLGSPHATGNVTCRANCTLNTDQCDAGKQCEKSSCSVISPSGNGGPPSLPPFQANCDACTTKVCAQDPHCCATSWDYTCYISAKELCGCQ
jgi:hypothetical protein